jgi:hypothetical protein
MPRAKKRDAGWWSQDVTGRLEAAKDELRDLFGKPRLRHA